MLTFSEQDGYVKKIISITCGKTACIMIRSRTSERYGKITYGIGSLTLILQSVLTLSNRSLFLLPLDPRVGTDGRVSYKVPQHASPRIVMRQRVVELWRDLANLCTEFEQLATIKDILVKNDLTWQTAPRNVGEVVVLIVIAYVEGDQVQGAVVRVGFETFLEHIVL